MIEIIYNIKWVLKVIFFPWLHFFISCEKNFPNVWLANQLPSRPKKNNNKSILQDMQRTVGASATSEFTTRPFIWNINTLHVNTWVVWTVPKCLNRKRKWFLSSLPFVAALFVGYSWLERISICLTGARKPSQISTSCWGKAQLNPCKPNVYPMWK